MQVFGQSKGWVTCQLFQKPIHFCQRRVQFNFWGPGKQPCFSSTNLPHWHSGNTKYSQNFSIRTATAAQSLFFNQPKNHFAWHNPKLYVWSKNWLIGHFSYFIYVKKDKDLIRTDKNWKPLIFRIHIVIHLVGGLWISKIYFCPFLLRTHVI